LIVIPILLFSPEIDHSVSVYNSFNNHTLSQHGAKQLKEEEARLGRVREDLADQKASFEKKKQSVRAITLLTLQSQISQEQLVLRLIRRNSYFLSSSICLVLSFSFSFRRRWTFKGRNRLVGQ
jgi:hypothetical protein